MRIAVGALFLCVLALRQGAAGPIIFGDTNVPDMVTACSPSCPELTTASGLAAFTLFADATITGFTFWTLESENSYQGGLLEWQILSELGGAPDAVISSGQFSMFPRNFVADVNVAGLELNQFQNNIILTSSLALSPDTPSQNYFLEIADNSNLDTFGVFWATANSGKLAFQLTGSGNEANPNNPNSNTPEPGGFLLAAPGLFTLASGLRRLTGASCR